MIRWGIRGLEMRMGQECNISRGEPDCAMEVYMLKELKERVTVLQQLQE